MCKQSVAVQMTEGTTGGWSRGATPWVLSLVQKDGLPLQALCDGGCIGIWIKVLHLSKHLNTLTVFILSSTGRDSVGTGHMSVSEPKEVNRAGTFGQASITSCYLCIHSTLSISHP